MATALENQQSMIRDRALQIPAICGGPETLIGKRVTARVDTELLNDKITYPFGRI